MLWYISTLHFLWGVCLILSPEYVSWTTPIHHLAIVFPVSERILGGLLIGAACASFFGLLCTGLCHMIRVLAFFPTQFLLIISCVGCITAVYQSQYADGVIRPQTFILADQLGYILASMFHTVILSRWLQRF